MGRPALAGSSRTIGAAYKRATPFRQCGGAADLGFVETEYFSRIIQWVRCISYVKKASAFGRTVGDPACPLTYVKGASGTGVFAFGSFGRYQTLI
jgi:hypothetical protein